MKIAIIDNYDSFTYNLAHLVRELGAEVDVLRNDQFRLEELEAYDKLLLSPGPGIPQEAGLLPEVIRMYAGRKPMLGVCLGHQAIGEAFGARLENLKEVYHGVQTTVSLLEEEAGGDYIFRGLPCRILAGRYHSWIVSADSIPPCLQVTSLDDGQVMALRHRVYDIHGIQFHPESVLTPDGKAIVSNWMNGAEN
ncbi:aminodeoxychorismate/anthranilate synthase component II [Bacteroides sp. ET71]|uniref:anthranilate synthase component II n=1 Tax=Bacteroides sp. ET71 TaxID=2939421 RepID=UPI0020110C10|nr:aminodeoxychorismate/anthranilate synthase component II [Bacteroides sp. ET71]MCL1616338.1 aminodeoxychorismate/anthranilate synthase component II [Bacteroides sp. ET71]